MESATDPVACELVVHGETMAVRKAPGNVSARLPRKMVDPDSLDR